MQEIIKKIALPVLLLLSFQLAFAQQPTPEEKKLLFDKIDTLLVNYIRYSRFLQGADLKISPEAINNFKQLFVSNDVTLPDEMSPLFFDTEKEKTGKKPVLPSGNSLSAEAGKLKNKVPVSQAANIQSNTVLHSIKDSLEFYLNGLNSGRDSFYQQYNDLNRKMAGYKEEMNLQEKIVDRTLAEFIQMVETNYQDGFSVKLLNSAVSFKEIESNKIKVLIRKKTEGKIYGSGVKLANTDTLLLTLHVSEQYSKILISNIEMIGYKLEFLNDDDHDFMSDPVDACPDERGLFTSTGCPDKEETKLENSLLAYLHTRETDSATAVASIAQVDTKITQTEARIKTLDNLINTRPRWVLTFGANTGVVTADFTNSASGYDYGGSNTLQQADINPASTFSGGKVVGGFGMLERYFGPKDKPANIGIAAGLAFNSLSGNVKKDTFHVEYKAVDKSNNNFTQIISAAEISEEINISNVSVPIVAIYRGNFTKKTLGFKVEAGIALNLFYKSQMSSTNPRFDYEAIYKYGTSFPGDQDYFDPGGTADPDPTSWLITKDYIGKHIGEENVVNYFERMNDNYPNIGLQKEPTSFNESATFQVGVSFMFRPSISFYFKGSSLNLGAYFIQTKFSQSGNYRLIDENKNYNTLMQGVSKASNSSYGIHISYSLPLFYYFSRWTKELSGLR